MLSKRMQFQRIVFWLWCVTLPTLGWAEEAPELTLWPQGLPAGAELLTADKIADLKAKANDPERINLVETPSLTIYRAPKESANGCGMIICPGGGYNILNLLLYQRIVQLSA